jgi:hypothetical protein
MPTKPIELADLRPDGLNPRIPAEEGQREIIAAILKEGGDKLLILTRDIATYGLSPMEPMLVMPAGKAYVALEGNRRLVALKILDNPRLAGDHKTAEAFRKLSANAAQKPTTIDCAVVGTREEANHWLTLRHTGENQGAGVVPWSAEQTQRFSGRSGSHAYAGVRFADAIATAFSSSPELITDLNKVRVDRLTTLGRLIQDPDFRKGLGMVLDENGIRWHYPTAALESTIRKLLGDLATTLSVSQIKSKEQRRDYLNALPKPDPKTYIQHPSTLQPAPQPSRKPRTKPASPPPKFVLADLSAAKMSGRIRAILSELQQLDVTKYPNATGVLLRVVVELMVDELLVRKVMKLALELKDKVRRALREVDPSEKDPRYAGVRAGLTDGTSVMATKTMHAFVHNPHYHPTPTELRAIASNYAQFLEALDSSLP